MTRDRTIRILIAKPGLDGHDVGAKVIARSLMEAGFDVTYTGLRKSPEEIVQRARELEVDVIGLSVLSGSHMPYCERIRSLLVENGMEDVLWLVGGVVPKEDHDRLIELGVAAVFPVGTPVDTVAAFIREKVV